MMLTCIYIVNSHYSIEAQATFTMVEMGKRKWVGIINIHVCAYNLLYYTQLAIIHVLLNETKKGGETSKSKILQILKGGI